MRNCDYLGRPPIEEETLRKSKLGKTNQRSIRPRKTADPLLPIQNPGPNEPLLVPTPLSNASILENAFECLIDLRGTVDEKAHIVESDHDMAVSVAEISNQEIVEEVPPTNLSSLDESVGLLNSREEEKEEEEEEVQIKSIVAVFEKKKIKHYNNQHKILLVGEGDFSFSACLAVAFGSATNIIATSLNSKESEYSEDDVDRVLWWDEENCDHDVAVSIPGFTRDEEDASRNVPFLEELVNSTKEEEEEEEEIQSVVVVREERWIKHYSSRHRILLVGEGDFSFSACLALKFLWAPNIIATSLDSLAFLEENYCKAVKNIEELKSRGSKVMHGINVSTMAKHQVVGQLTFDRIIFNFPYAGLSVVKDMPRQSQLRHHQRLVREFMENAKEMISEKGEIHITHKTNGFHGEWSLVSLASREGLRLIDAVKFNLLDYPGYYTKCGFGGNNFFNCNPSKTYKFGLQ